ncbi:MAG: hypothetical protein D5R97_00560 [Candidatus Syntrophonatronum acetioxidans]|uniref:Uncharacterized protein n=1 Tax=Candidatus Syntrophonatronum acetioxidans TaxID=1795816 RepID=A0A424YIU1_9FIRM|nr:MAG: hypothetical protein D5R97_00560 [Candidatus Syntrophonatronum acetioxidans]
MDRIKIARGILALLRKKPGFRMNYLMIKRFIRIFGVKCPQGAGYRGRGRGRRPFQSSVPGSPQDLSRRCLFFETKNDNS